MQMMYKVVHKTKMFGELVMFSHTLFSPPLQSYP